MDPIGNEWSEWGQQPAGDSKNFIQGGKGRAIVLFVDLVEAVPALADVPLRHVLVEEIHHRLGGIRRFEAAEQLVGLALDGREA
jgi:hypothetical protein